MRKKRFLYNQETEECILSLQGEKSYSVVTSTGTDWEFKASEGVQDVSIDEEELIVCYGKKQVRYSLPVKQLKREELFQVLSLFDVFQKAKNWYWHEQDSQQDLPKVYERVVDSESDRGTMRK